MGGNRRGTPCILPCDAHNKYMTTTNEIAVGERVVCGIERAAGVVLAVKRIDSGADLYRVRFDDPSTPPWFMTSHETRREADA